MKLIRAYVTSNTYIPTIKQEYTFFNKQNDGVVHHVTDYVTLHGCN